MRDRVKYLDEFQLQKFLIQKGNWFKVIDDQHFVLDYAEYPIFGLTTDNQKPCGRIDYIFRNSLSGQKFAVECKVGGNRDMWHNLSSLKVLGYKELYEYDRFYKDGKDEKITPAVLITKDALSLNVIYVLNALKVKCFVVYPGPTPKITTFFLRKLPGYMLNTIIHSDAPPENLRQFPYER